MTEGAGGREQRVNKKLLLNLCSLLSAFTIPAAFATPAVTESTFDAVLDARGSLDSSTDSVKLLPNVLETVLSGPKCNKRREQRAEIQQHFLLTLCSLFSALSTPTSQL